MNDDWVKAFGSHTHNSAGSSSVTIDLSGCSATSIGNSHTGNVTTGTTLNDDCTIWGGGTLNGGPAYNDKEVAEKLLHDPEFDVGRVLVDMVAKYLAENRDELGNDPVIGKYLK
jgi:hypothetical protein